MSDAPMRSNLGHYLNLLLDANDIRHDGNELSAVDDMEMEIHDLRVAVKILQRDFQAFQALQAHEVSPSPEPSSQPHRADADMVAILTDATEALEGVVFNGFPSEIFSAAEYTVSGEALITLHRVYDRLSYLISLVS